MTPIDKPGFYPEITPEIYHADPVWLPSLSSTTAKTLISKSPRHAWLAHPKLGGAKADDDEETPEKSNKGQRTGTLMHRLLLDKGGELVEIPYDNWKKELAKALRDEALLAGKIPVLSHELATAAAATKEVRYQLDELGYEHVFRTGLREIVIIWQENGIWLRAMLDNLIIDEEKRTAEIWDLKTTARSSHPKACESLIRSLGYDLSAEFYKRAVAAVRPDLNGRIKFKWAFAEVAAPHAVTPVDINGEWSTVAFSSCERAIEGWRRCMVANKWPLYTTELLTLEPQPWQLLAEFGAQPTEV